ncbi:MAG: hypothetical protein GXP06_12875 [Alphaproteobacteria bacterium]|nr:hypothetical protein [Alphaproteobacteria bacterium]
MKIRKFAQNGILAGGVFAIACIFPNAGSASEAHASPVQFENSCSAQVQADFSHAVALLHSFEYPESPRIFKKIIANDPDCAMAYWGVAMNLWHPLWAPPSKETLQEGAMLLSETDGLAKTPREAAYIDALKAFYSRHDHKQSARTCV